MAGTLDADCLKIIRIIRKRLQFQYHSHYGFNMAKDNTALLTVVNEVLKTAKSDGTYNDIYKKWFGTDAPKE